MADAIQWFPPGRMALEFMRSNAFFRGIRGPFGSGKSTTCVMEILRRAREMPPCKDGIRRSRWAVVRNTYPELKTTTIPTWHQWVRPELGGWRDHGPPSHRLRDKDLDLEVWFIALDDPSDVKRLLSMELTAAWLNEARELTKAVVDGITGRVGRYPAVDMVQKPEGWQPGQPLYWHGVIADTNSPDMDHWWQVLAQRDTSNERGRELVESVDKAEALLREKGMLQPGQKLFEFFAQPGGRSPGAENVAHLQPGYYERLMAGKRADWIKVYVDAKYGFVMDGRAVYPEYQDDVHCKPFELDPGMPLSVGFDFGLTPAAVIGQESRYGQWLTRHEFVSTDMGVANFAPIVAKFLREHYSGWAIRNVTGDPAGDSRDYREENAFDLLKEAGLVASKASTNDYTPRIEAVASGMRKLTPGGPGTLVHPDCATLRRGWGGGYCYRRMQVVGREEFKDVPDKQNPYSHVCEADQYMKLGAGMGNVVLRGTRSKVHRPTQASGVGEVNL